MRDALRKGRTGRDFKGWSLLNLRVCRWVPLLETKVVQSFSDLRAELRA